MNVNSKKKIRIVRLNPAMYPLRVVYSACYLLCAKAYIALDGDPRKKIIVRIKAKNGADPAKLAEELHNELLNASLRYRISRENKRIREYIVGSALLSVVENRMPKTEDCGCGQQQPLSGADTHTALKAQELRAREKTHAQDTRKKSRLKDTLGIAVRWEEKYGDFAQARI